MRVTPYGDPEFHNLGEIEDKRKKEIVYLQDT